MLVLSRRRDESLVIAGNIRITVLNGNGHTTRLGIEAPRTVSIMRSELLKEANSADAPRDAVPREPMADGVPVIL